MDYETLKLILNSNEHLELVYECDEHIWWEMESSLFITIYDEWNDVRLEFNMPSGMESYGLVLYKGETYDLEIPLHEYFGVPCCARFMTDQIDEIKIEKL